MAINFPASPSIGDQVTAGSIVWKYDGEKWVTIRSLFDRGVISPGTSAAPGLPILGDEDTGIFSPGANQLAVTTGGTQRLLIDASGNTTVAGDFTVNGTTTTIDSQTLIVEDKNIEMGSVTTPTDTTADGGGITLKGASDKTINWVQSTGCWTFNQPTNFNDHVRIDSSGNVGIGTLSPTVSYGNGLHIAGGSAGLKLQNTNNSDWAYIEYADESNTTKFIQGYRDQSGVYGIRPGTSLNATPGLSLDSSGRVGIGTSSLVSKFTIDNGGRADPSSTGSTTQSNSSFEINADSESNTRLMAGINTGSKFWMQVQNTSDSGTSDILLNPIGGNVGIGSSNPQELLQVGAGANSVNGTLLISADAGFHNFIRFTNGGGTESHYPAGIWYQPAGRMELRAASSSSASNAAQLVLASNGNVGIGTSSPSTKLEVTGDVKVVNTGIAYLQPSTVTAFQAYESSGPATINLNNNGTATFAADATINTLTVGRGASNNQYNTAIGSGVLANNTTGVACTGVGYYALVSNTTGSNTGLGYQALYSTTTGSDNTATGRNALVFNTTGERNTATGHEALYSNTTGSYCTATGWQSLYSNTTGIYNVAYGYGSLDSNTSGSHNTALGATTLRTNTTGERNTANGSNALYYNTTGSYNVANGFYALHNNTTGINNTANGFRALNSNTTGTNNVANGAHALYSNTTGPRNTAIGKESLYYNITGDDNIGLGYMALRDTTGSGNIGIGFLNNAGTYAPVFNPTTENNRLVLGHTSITNAYVKVSWTVTSDERDKMNFAPVPYGLDFVNQLKPTAYQFKVDRDTETPSGDVRYGFKAQDILALEGDNPVIIDTEDVDHLKYKGEHLVPVLVNAVQELTTMVKELQTEIAALKGA